MHDKSDVYVNICLCVCVCVRVYVCVCVCVCMVWGMVRPTNWCRDLLRRSQECIVTSSSPCTRGTDFQEFLQAFKFGDKKLSVFGETIGACICTCVCIYTYIYIYACIFKHIHTCIYLRLQRDHWCVYVSACDW
jgi:hypothetical protein